jgi:hypothetical protein
MPDAAESADYPAPVADDAGAIDDVVTTSYPTPDESDDAVSDRTP